MYFHALLDQFGPALNELSLAAIGTAALAGVLASAVCPCTLPVGLGVASLSSASAFAADAPKSTGFRPNGMLIAVLFFAGIVSSLTLLGVMADRLGVFLTESFGRYWALGMAAFSMMAAVVAFRGPCLKVGQLAAVRSPGLAGAFAYGILFSLGTSVAPLLLLLTVAAAESDPGFGLALGLAFGVGRGSPFLLVGIFAGTIAQLTRLGTWRRTLQILSGSILLLLGGYFTWVFLNL